MIWMLITLLRFQMVILMTILTIFMIQMAILLRKEQLLVFSTWELAFLPMNETTK